jgi:hypothetical protein
MNKFLQFVGAVGIAVVGSLLIALVIGLLVSH